jgi:hypothetical protein
MWKAKSIKIIMVGLVIAVMVMAGGCFNKPPEIASLTADPSSVARGDTSTVSCTASDPNADDTLSYAWSATGGSVSGTGNSITWTAPDAEGSYSVTVTVSDSNEAVSDSCDIQVVNSAPVIASLNPSSSDVAPEESVTIACSASDADGDTLTYTWSATGGTVTGTGASVSWEAPAAEGTYTVSVTVDDGHGGSDSASCDIVVEMKYGAIDIQSDPAGAAVYLDGVDTGNITPFVVTNLSPGTYTVKLAAAHYKYREANITVLPNETTYINWSLTYAPEQTVTLELTDTLCADSYVYEDTPTSNYGTDDYLFAGGSVDALCRTFLEFAMPTIPENAVITDARLGLFYNSTQSSNPTAIGVYPVLENWSDTDVTWDYQPTFATEEADIVNLPSSVSASFIYWHITDLVADWYDGILSNFGLVFKSPSESGDSWKGFYASDYSTVSRCPKFIINYYDPTS